MTVLTLERLPPEVNVTGAILLEPSISRRYDLSTALARTSQGIWSFYSWLDFLFEGVATSLAGTTDGKYGPAAGMIGFRPPAGEYYSAVEAPKGELGWYIVSHGDPNPYKIHCRAASYVNLQSLPVMAEGDMIADTVAIIGLGLVGNQFFDMLALFFPASLFVKPLRFLPPLFLFALAFLLAVTLGCGLLFGRKPIGGFFALAFGFSSGKLALRFAFACQLFAGDAQLLFVVRQRSAADRSG